MYATVDFTCIGIVELCGAQNKWELQYEKFLPTVEFDPSTFRLLDRHIIHCTLKPTGLIIFIGKLYGGFMVQWITRLPNMRDVLNHTAGKFFFILHKEISRGIHLANTFLSNGITGIYWFTWALISPTYRYQSNNEGPHVVSIQDLIHVIHADY